MKRFLLAVLALFLLAGQALAASSMTVTVDSISQDGSQMVVKIAATAHTDGTFDNRTIATTDIVKSTLGLRAEYYQLGYSLKNAYAVNPASTYPTSGAVTITDSNGNVLVGTAAGDTLTLSTSASGVALLSIERGSGQRAVTKPLTIAVSDTGSAANTFTLYLVLGK